MLVTDNAANSHYKSIVEYKNGGIEENEWDSVSIPGISLNTGKTILAFLAIGMTHNLLFGQ